MAINTPVYSIIYDKSLASDPEACLTYAGSCEGFTPMSNPNNGNCDEGSWAEGNGTIFDAIEVGSHPHQTWTKIDKSSITTSALTSYFTKIPKIYQKVTDISDAGDNSKVKLDLSLKPFDGASPHPSFVRDGSEINNLYIGRYLGYLDGTLLSSFKGKTPTVSKSRANFRTYAKNRGSGFALLKYYDWDLVNKLYLLAFKNFNSQTTLGLGYCDSDLDIASTGATDGKSWMYGLTTAYTHVSFLGLEDWWGNCWQIIDDFYGNNGAYYAGNNSNPTDNTSNKTMIAEMPPGYDSSTSRWDGVPLSCLSTTNGFFIAEKKGGTSNTSGLCDKQIFNYEDSIGLVGGAPGQGTVAGAFTLYTNQTKDYASDLVSARLTYVD